MRTASKIAWGTLLALSLPLWLAVSSPNGDLWSRWTDHLRHEGESIALQQRGLHLYELTYGEATTGLPLPCPEHQGLWPNTGTPYPPLGILLHWPIARLELAGLLAPATAHRLLVWLFGAVAICCIALGVHSLQGARRVLFLALFGPLLLGAGFSGFYDTVWVLAALVAIATHSRAAAVLAYLVHFRAVATLSYVRWGKDAVIAIGLALVNTTIALIASLHLGVFDIHSQLHYSRAAAWWFPVFTTITFWFVRRETSAVPLIVTALLLFTDRQASFWHLLLLVPLGFSVLRTGSTRAVLLITLWMIVTAQAFLDTWIPFQFAWLTQR